MTDFWNTIDSAVSLLAAQEGVHLASWTLAREFGSNEYRVIVKKAGAFAPFPPEPGHPVSAWLSRMGLPAERLEEMATMAATEMVADARWTPVHESEHGWVRGAWRRPSAMAWQWDEDLSHLYWSAASLGRGLPDHAWLADLRSDLSAPQDPTSRRRVLGSLARLLSYEDWEGRSGLSLRAWAATDPAWQDVLDQAGVGYGARVDGVPLLMCALANEAGDPGWRRILAGALDHRMELIVPPEDLPAAWWDAPRLGPPPALPLWSWAARVASAPAWDLLLSDRPDLLSATDSGGCSALHWAALSGNDAVVTLLLNKGANPAIENLDGLLPEQVVPSGKDDLYEQLASQRLARPRPGS